MSQETVEGSHGAPIQPGADPVERLLAELNPAQREAVTHGEGPLLVLAGAGSGKTRALTHRIAWLLATGRARPTEILAITFTNKAAGEMRERVGQLLGGISRAMWVMTFHSACARILRGDAGRLGYKRAFTIYDEADAQRMIRRCLDELDVDPKRFPPRAVKAAISGAKNGLIDAADYAEAQGSPFEETVADVYALYERRMLEASAMDFDDLLVRTVNLLELFADVREKYRRIFRWVLVDEYQDTNRAQYRLLQLLAEEHRNLTVVGDDFQCLLEGTEVTMGDGSTKAVESLDLGDEVRSCYGGGDFRPAPVTGIYKAVDKEGISIVTAGGRQITSTAEHMHFAGFKARLAPQLHLAYVMWKRGVGFRVGTTRVHTDRRGKSILGLQLRCFMEGADAAWVVSAHSTEIDARLAETLLSLRYGLPTLPFVARIGRKAGQSVVADQDRIDEVFEAVDSESAGRHLLADEGLSFQHPHHLPGSFLGRRRTLTLTMCGERRGATPMHRIAMVGRDQEGKEALESLNLSVRPAKRGSDSWRYETCLKDMSEAVRTAGDVSMAMEVSVRIVGRFGRDRSGNTANSLPCIPAGSIRPGMAMFTEDGGYDLVESVERVAIDRPLYDINVEGTHNFVANGLVTHNSVYSFRGADIRNILEFERDFPDATTVLLEQNYRSTQTILETANGLIAHNPSQKEKHLWTDGLPGENVTIAELDDEHAEARYVAGEIQALIDAGVSREEIAVFYRMNAQSRVLEDTLVRFEMPYQVIGGTKFYDRAEVKDAVAYLSLLANPADAVCFGRVVNSPRRGIGQQTQARLLSHSNTTGEEIWDVFSRPEAVPGLGSAALKAVARFAEVMATLRAKAEATDSVAEILDAVLRESGYIEALEAERTIEAEGRVENLEELVGVAGEFDANRELEGDADDVTPLEEFLAQIRLLSEQDNLRDAESLITLMTLHNAKGLEYDAVFMIGCEEGVFPHSRSVEEGNLEEERRLCYVGVTRARERLWMSFARRRSLHGSSSWNLPSRFLSELPEALVDRHSATTPIGWSSGAGAGTPRDVVLGGSRGAGLPASSPKQPVQPPIPYAVGDDVVHATFGEGVVTSIEAGSVVVIRFAGDGAERKLMADYAPLRKVA